MVAGGGARTKAVRSAVDWGASSGWPSIVLLAGARATTFEARGRGGGPRVGVRGAAGGRVRFSKGLARDSSRIGDRTRAKCQFADDDDGV